MDLRPIIVVGPFTSIAIGIVLLFLVVGFSGCTDEDILEKMTIVSFVVNPSIIELGGTANLSWVVTGSDTTVSIDNDIGYVSLTGERIISPTETTTYTLTATNKTSTKSATTQIMVTIDTREVTGETVFDSIDVYYINAETRASRWIENILPMFRLDLFSDGLSPNFATEDRAYYTEDKWDYCYIISGSVKHNDTRSIRDVIITATLYDSNMNLLKSGNAFFRNLQINQTRSFQIWFSDKDFASFEQADNYELTYTVIL